MGFEKMYITKKGALLSAKTLQGKKIVFDHAEVGSGTLSGNAFDKTSLTTKVLSCDITNVEITQETQARVSFIFKNTDASKAFYFREIGLFAIDPDTKEKILYAYSNAGDTAEYINNSIAEKIEKHISINIIVDNASNVSITLNENEIYATKKDLAEAINTARETTGKTYGIRHKLGDVNSKWERTGNSVGLVANATKDGSAVQNDFDDLYPWSDIISYNYDTTNKKITAYYGDDEFKFDGSNGEVLTRIPEFWFRRKITKEDDIYYDNFEIADYARAGFKHISEFSLGRYDLGELKETVDGTTTTSYHSRSGLYPAVNKTTNQFRTICSAFGDGFSQLDSKYFYLAILYLVEYADTNSQSKLGRGVTEFFNQKALIAENSVNRIIVTNSNNMYVGRCIAIGKTDSWNSDVAWERQITKIEDFSNGSVTGKAVYFDGDPVDIVVGNALWGIGQKSGQCNDLGMKSGTLNNDGCHSMIYRGVEDAIGNVLQGINNINIKDHVAYICSDPTQCTDNKYDSPYEKLGYTNYDKGDGYGSRWGYDENHPEILIPTEINGSSSTGTCDKYWQADGNKFVRVGGFFSTGPEAGFFFVACSDGFGWTYWNCGARLLKYQ